MVAEVGVEEIVRALELAPHPEGGFFRETYRAASSVSTPAGLRAASTAIYFLVPRGSFSALHRIQSDELWHHYAGAPLDVVSIRPDGARVDLRLGGDVASGEVPQGVVPAGAWFGARIPDGATGEWSLVGCTVAPGFDFADFELADRDRLITAFPAHRALIVELTR